MKLSTVGLIVLMLLSVGSSLRAEESEGEKAFQSYAKHAVGGVWKTTAPVTEVVDGEMTVTDQMVDMVDEYRSFADGQFVRYFATRDGKTGDFIGVLGVDKDNEEWYQVSIGGKQGNDASLGKVIGRAFAAEEMPEVIQRLVEVYIKERTAEERFIDTVRRIGMEPFKAHVYAEQEVA